MLAGTEPSCLTYTQILTYKILYSLQRVFLILFLLKYFHVWKYVTVNNESRETTNVLKRQKFTVINQHGTQTYVSRLYFSWFELLTRVFLISLLLFRLDSLWLSKVKWVCNPFPLQQFPPDKWDSNYNLFTMVVDFRHCFVYLVVQLCPEAIDGWTTLLSLALETNSILQSFDKLFV